MKEIELPDHDDLDRDPSGEQQSLHAQPDGIVGPAANEGCCRNQAENAINGEQHKAGQKKVVEVRVAKLFQ